MHFAQALTLSPDNNLTHCKLGCCLLLIVGLNFSALNLTLRQTFFDFLAQIAHSRAIWFYYNKIFIFYKFKFNDII